MGETRNGSALLPPTRCHLATAREAVRVLAAADFGARALDGVRTTDDPTTHVARDRRRVAALATGVRAVGTL